MMKDEYLSDDEEEIAGTTLDTQKHFMNDDIVKIAKNMIPKAQLVKTLIIPAEAALPSVVPVYIHTPATEFLNQLSVPSVYNEDLSSTKEGLAIVQAMKNTSENLLESLISTYRFHPNTCINSVHFLI